MDLESSSPNTPNSTVKGGIVKTSSGFERRDVIDSVKKHLSSIDKFHGALTERVLLYGSSGCGKRRIATQAAQEIAGTDGRKLLFVEAGTFEIFIRDYYDVYFILTGEKLPAGLGVPLSLSKIKYTLERRRQEWLLVLLDVAAFMDDSNNNTRQKMNIYVPDRGQIIMTSSEVITGSTKGSKTGAPELICALELAAGPGSIYLPNVMGSRQFYHYARHLCPALLDASKSALSRLQGSNRSILIFLTVAAANLRLLNVSFGTYTKMQIAKAGKQPPKAKPVARVVAAFNAAMHILWDALADRDRWALKLLAAVAVAEPLGTPFHLIQRLPLFKGTVSDRLSPALDLLLSLQLVHITGNGADPEIITMHQQIFSWIRRHIRHANSDKEFSALVHSWIEVLAEAIKDDPTNETPRIERWWALAPVIWSVINAAAPRVVASVKFLEFVISVAELIIEDRRLPNYAGIFIDEAYKVWTNLLGKELKKSLDAESFFIRIKHVRTRAYLCVSERMLAEQDLRHAKNALDRMKLQLSEISPELQRKIEELEVRVCLAQERHVDAERLLDRILDDPEPGVSPATVAQRHNWMAVALSNQNLDVAALQHSHCAMKYWAEQPQEVKRGKTDVMMIGWVDKHASLLVGLQKYRGALLFLPKLFDIWTELVPYGSTIVWRIANSLVFCYANIDKVAEAEKVAIRMLEMSPIDETHGDSLFYALYLLHELGVLYLRHGRNVEAEGIFRFNLRTVKKRDIKPLFAVNGNKVPADWWAQLVVVLNTQGRPDEARKVRDEYQDEKHDENFMDKFLSEGQKKYALSRDLYQRAMWAEEAGMLKEWKTLLRESSEAKERSAYRRAIKQFSTVTRRVRDNLPIEHEIDFHLCARARKSRVLHLLNRNLIYMSFTGKFLPKPDEDDEETDHDDWLPPHQHLVTEYFHFCDCRRHRKRSGSINPVEFIDKRFSRQSATEEDKPKKLKQLHITDHFFIMLNPPPILTCPTSCPCRDATLRGEADYADMEFKLWDVDDSLRPPAYARFPSTSQPLIRTSALLPDEVFIQDKEKNYWRWVQTELALGEGPEENYIVPLSLSIPILTITPPEGQEELTEVKNEEDIQPKITKYLKRDYAYDMMIREARGGRHEPHVLDDILEDEEVQSQDGREDNDDDERQNSRIHEENEGLREFGCLATNDDGGGATGTGTGC